MSENTIFRLLGDALVLDSDGHLVGIMQVPASKNVIVIADDYSINKDTTVNFPLTPEQLKNIKGAAITINAVYNASATAGIDADLHASGEGTEYDTTPFIQDMQPPFSAGNKEQITLPVNLGIYAGRIVVKNLDLTYAVNVSIYLVH